VPKNRLEAFSDGVFAIAITLLVLEIDVPEAAEGGLWSALLDQWPSYAAYLVSFAVIGIIWVNHHRATRPVARVDTTLLFLTLLLLLFVAVLPFPTALLAEYILHPADADVAAAVYSATMLGMAVAFNLQWRWIARSERLLHAHIDPVSVKVTARGSLGIFLYAGTVALSFVSPLWTLAVHGALAVYYMVDQFAIAETTTQGEEPAG
jgi:uncharacterized membrane protein